MSYEYDWCSWCHNKTGHKLINRNYMTRNEYQCMSCQNYTVKCRYCKNMATYKPRTSSSNKKFIESIKENWGSELCAEHDGSIADFDKLSMQINDLSNYEVIFERSKWNLAKGGKIAGGMVAGALVFCPAAYLAAPGLASALGSTGVLGLAGTQTAISTLSGAALTSASLAAIGSGGVATGMAIVTASGAALGGVAGAAVSNSYFGAIKDFKVTKIKDGSGPNLVFINGFLSQKNQDASDWIRGVSRKFPDNPYYYVNWESSNLYNMGSLICKGVGATAFKAYIKKLVVRGSRKFVQKINPLNWAQTIAELIKNPWHTSMVKASMTGILLADLIARTKNPNGFILMGHSLGARVIYYLLTALSTKNSTLIKDAYLFGGAVGINNPDAWDAATKAVSGKIINFYSDNDNILRYLYKGANALLSNPIGLGGINSTSNKIINVDATSIVDGHMRYKENLNLLFNKV